MRVNRVGLLLLLPLLFGARDPFKAPESRCSEATLNAWRYTGVVMGAVPVGIVKDDQERWLRVRHDDMLPTGWRVADLDEKELIIDTRGACEPPLRRWQRQGTKQDENKDPGPTVAREPDAGRTRSSDPGGG